MTRELLVVRSGPLSTIQDLGRHGWAHLGVPTSGAADRASLRLANRLVGNVEGAAGIEVTVGGLELRSELSSGADLSVAVTGATCPITLAGRPAPSGALLRLTAGSHLRLAAAQAGVRAYVAVRGGLVAPSVLGSRSTDTLSGLGPAALEDGDRLAVGDEVAGWPVLAVAPVAAAEVATIRVHAILGPRDGVLAAGGHDLLREATWLVSQRSDRIGVRLSGPRLPVRDGASQASEPMVRGAIQLPPGGLPVIFLADHPVTGGYPVVAVVTDADVDRLAQLRPGQGLRLDLAPPPDLH